MDTSVYQIFSSVTDYPQYNYVSRPDLEEALRDCIFSNRIAFVFGASKTGKTVLVEHVVRNIDGFSGYKRVGAQNFKSSDSFWVKVATELGISQSVTRSRGKSQGKSKSVGMAAKIIAWFAGEATIDGKLEKTEDKSESIEESFISDPVAEISNSKKVLIIDNFHYILDRNVQTEILQVLKESQYKFPIVIVAITDRDAYLKERLNDLGGGRYRPIQVYSWSYDHLKQIALLGFTKLRAKLTPLVWQQLFNESFSAPAIVQELCRNLALQKGLQYPSRQEITITQDDVNLFQIYKATSQSLAASTEYKELLGISINSSQLISTVTIRKMRNIKNDVQVSFHEAILQTLYSVEGLTIERTVYLSELQSIFREISLMIDISDEDVPAVFEQVLKELNGASEELFKRKIMDNAHSSSIDTPLFEYNNLTKRVTILDPYFAFYVKWSGDLLAKNY